ncbi:hypothetical protein ABHN03_04095 [Paenibacillus sp. NRS-1775]|uniref:hypothetical protein n=1 Tax=unclassified Paenibacillus TaxID=185978 RepID=UPI003D2733F5
MRYVDNEHFMRRISDIAYQVEGFNYTVSNKNNSFNNDKVIEYRKNRLEEDIIQFLHDVKYGVFK